jgi:hypothetical protein
MTGPSRRAGPKPPARPSSQAERVDRAVIGAACQPAVLDAADRIMALGVIRLSHLVGSKALPLAMAAAALLASGVELAERIMVVAVRRPVALDAVDRIVSAVRQAGFANRAVAAAGQGLAGRSGRTVVLA